MLIKKFLATVLLLCLSSAAFSQGRVAVHVTNFSNNKGSSIICLYNSAGEFTDKGTPVQCTTVTITNKITRTFFENLPPGQYAVLVIHDANNNRKFDTNFLGIPKEGYGASGNKLPFAAAPKFEENKFTVTDGITIECFIKLRYIF